MKNLLTKSASVLEVYPSLGYEGFRHASDNFVDDDWSYQQSRLLMPLSQREIETTIRFLSLKHSGQSLFSGGLKHEAETWGQSVDLEGYVSNGSAIVGAILFGYTAEVVPESSRCYLHWLSVNLPLDVSFNHRRREDVA